MKPATRNTFIDSFDRAVRERNRRASREADNYNAQTYICSDCGAEGTQNYTGVSVTGKVFCTECAHRRQHDDPRYLFDPRSWDAIARWMMKYDK